MSLYTKARQFTLRYFHEIFKSDIYIQKSLQFTLRDIFIYKKPDTSQEGIQFELRLYIKNPDTLCYAIFHGMFEIGRGRGNFLCKKQCTLHYIFLCKKMHFLFRF